MENTFPFGWEKKKFEDLIESNVLGLVRNVKQQSLDFSYDYVKMNNVTNDNRFTFQNITRVNADEKEVQKFMLKKGDFLFNTRNSFELVGKSCVYNDEKKNVLFNNNLMRVRFKNDVNSHFILYQFSSPSVKHQLEKVKSGTTNVSAIYYKSLKEIFIHLPPLEEQKRIVAKIDTLFAKIDKAISLTEESLKQAKNLLPSVLKEVFEKGKADGWEEKKLEEVIEKTKNVNPKTSSFDEFTYVDISAVDKSLQEIVLPKTVKSIDAPSRAKKSIELDDILFATTRPNLKNIAIVSVKYEFPIASTGFCVVRSNSEAHNRYLFYYLISDLLQEQIKPFIRGAQYPAISDKDLKSVLIPVPNLKEQIQVSALFDKISDESKQTQSKLERKLAYLKQLKSSILSKAFKGEL